jgi:hypothetical protein
MPKKDDNKNNNATWLFEKPHKKFHNAESWWTSIFSAMILWLEANKKNNTKTIKIKTCRFKNNKKTTPTAKLKTYRYSKIGGFERAGGISFKGAGFSNLIIDGSLKCTLFDINDGNPEWSKKYNYLRPDITFIQKKIKKAVFIECKTIGSTVKISNEKYKGLVEFLNKNGWTAKLYFLLSHGHNDSDWPHIEKEKLEIILWEDALELMKETPFFEIFRDVWKDGYITKPNFAKTDPQNMNQQPGEEK